MLKFIRMRVVKRILPLFLIFISCSKDPSLLQVKNLDPAGNIGAFGHGGMGIKSLWPMDSYNSLRAAIESGADGTEMDVQMSRDSVFFLFHDTNLQDATHCRGTIAEMQSAELDCTYRSLAHSGTRLCRLSTFLDDFAAREDLTLTFEVKLGSDDRDYWNCYARNFAALLRRYKMEKRCLLESTQTGFLMMLRQAEPSLRLFLYSADVSSCIRQADSLDLFGVTFNMDLVNAGLVSEAHQRNLRVTLFGQHSEQDNIRTVQMSPDFIQTDKLKHLLQILGKR